MANNYEIIFEFKSLSYSSVTYDFSCKFNAICCFVDNMLPLSIPACRSYATVRARQHHSVRVLQPRTHTLPQLLRGAGGVPRGGGRGHVARGGHVVNTDVVLLYKC